MSTPEDELKKKLVTESAPVAGAASAPETNPEETQAATPESGGIWDSIKEGASKIGEHIGNQFKNNPGEAAEGKDKKKDPMLQLMDELSEWLTDLNLSLAGAIGDAVKAGFGNTPNNPEPNAQQNAAEERPDNAVGPEEPVSNETVPNDAVETAVNPETDMPPELGAEEGPEPDVQQDAAEESPDNEEELKESLSNETVPDDAVETAVSAETDMPPELGAEEGQSSEINPDDAVELAVSAETGIPPESGGGEGLSSEINPDDAVELAVSAQTGMPPESGGGEGLSSEISPDDAVGLAISAQTGMPPESAPSPAALSPNPDTLGDPQESLTSADDASFDTSVASPGGTSPKPKPGAAEEENEEKESSYGLK